MSATPATLRELGLQRPEWTPWLSVVQAAMDEARSDGWAAVVPEFSSSPGGEAAPLLAGCALRPGEHAGRLFDALARAAARGGTPALVQLAGLARADAVALSAFEAALNGDEGLLEQVAGKTRIDAGAFRAVAALLPVPLLHACRRAWSGRAPRGWRAGYCPVCGAWPAFAEVRGIERSRYLRCSRCAGAWESACLSCPYCGTTDHEQLGSLVPDGTGARSAVEVCRRCRGYLKSFTRLTAAPPESVMVDDFASVELDLAALERGYGRPAGLGFPLRTTITA